MRWDQTEIIRWNPKCLPGKSGSWNRSALAWHCYHSNECFRLNYKQHSSFVSVFLFLDWHTHTLVVYEPAFDSHQSQIYMWFMHVNRFTIFPFYMNAHSHTHPPTNERTRRTHDASIRRFQSFWIWNFLMYFSHSISKYEMKCINQQCGRNWMNCGKSCVNFARCKSC